MSEQTINIPQQVEQYKTKFLKYNQYKLDNLYACISRPDVVNVFKYIPLLLHVNSPELPGYINNSEMPTGIFGYTPSTDAVTFIRNMHPSMVLPKVPEKSFIEMFALMGSGGTIAFTDQSDFDFWICVNESTVSVEALSVFKTKCRIIEEWVADNYNTEVHFFVNDIEKVKRNIFDEDDENNLAGTSLGQLLKEEFFRSSIVVNGKIPFWWVVPPGTNEKQYTSWLKSISGSPLSDQFIDIGNLNKMLKKDFSIAALFQILKSLGNPFKSIIKLGLLERYLNDYKENPFISDIIKTNVHNEKLEPKAVDAYIIMFDLVFDYYSTELSDPGTINFIKTCFYLKVDPKLSRNATKQENSLKIDIMKIYSKEWGWVESTINHIDNFEEWDIEKVKNIMTITKKFILKRYKEIKKTLDVHKSELSIDDSASMSIQRKILSHFSLDKNKVDNTLNFKNYPAEKLLTIEFIREVDGKEYWLLSKKVISNNFTAKVQLYKMNSLIGLIIWISLNGFYKKDYTRLDMDPGLHAIDPNFIRELITELALHFSLKKVDLQNSFFIKEPFPIISYLVFNPYSKYSKKIDDIFFLYHNSWGETRFEVFKSEQDLATIIVHVVNSGLVTHMDFEHVLNITSAYPFHASKEFDRIRKVVKDVYTFFINNRGKTKKRYITVLGNEYFVFISKFAGETEMIFSNHCGTEIKMLYSISYNRGVQNLIGTDPTVPDLNYIRTITENYDPGAIQIYFQYEKKYSYYFISDERGSLMFFRKKSSYGDTYLTSLYLFVQNTLEKIKKSNPQNPLFENETSNNIKIYRLERNNNNCAITQVNPELDQNIFRIKKDIVKVTLSLHLMDNGEIGYRFTLPDGGFTEVLNRANIVNVAKEVKKLMEAQKGYTYFISDINLEFTGLKLYQQFSTLAIAEKNRFELMLETGL